MASLDKLVILSVSAGTGHMRAAQAVQKLALELNPSAEVKILDTFNYASPFWEKLILGAYMEMLKNAPQIYGYLYRRSEKGHALSGLAKVEFNRVLNKIASTKLFEYLKTITPQAVLCTHPFPLGVMAEIKRKGKVQYPVFAAITDFTVHPFWIFPETDYYLVASEKLIPDFIDYQIDLKRIKATGIPIDPCFNIQEDKSNLKQKYQLEENVPTVLVVGGGLGMGPIEKIVRELGSCSLNLQLIVVTGSNNALKDKIQSFAPELPNAIRVLGFVNDMHLLMGASDLLVGKAGGLTCAEAMAVGLPVFIIDPIPGQEERNVEFLQGQDAAMLVNEDNIVHEVKGFLGNSQLRKKMSAAAHRLGKSNSARETVLLIQEIISKDIT